MLFRKAWPSLLITDIHDTAAGVEHIDIGATNGETTHTSRENDNGDNTETIDRTGIANEQEMSGGSATGGECSIPTTTPATATEAQVVGDARRGERSDATNPEEPGDNTRRVGHSE